MRGHWPVPGCSVHGHWPVPGCSVHGHWPVPVCSVMVTDLSLVVHYIGHWPVPGCSVHGHWPVPGCSVHGHWPVPGCSLHWSLTCPWLFIARSLTCPWLFSAWSLTCPWLFSTLVTDLSLVIQYIGHWPVPGYSVHWSLTCPWQCIPRQSCWLDSWHWPPRPSSCRGRRPAGPAHSSGPIRSCRSEKRRLKKRGAQRRARSRC